MINIKCLQKCQNQRDLQEKSIKHVKNKRTVFISNFWDKQEGIVEQYTFAILFSFYIELYQMKGNSGQPSTPSGLFSARLRLCSVNSPFISPLRIVPSPYINDPNFFDQQQSNADLNHFQLEEPAPIEKQKEEQINQNQEEESQIQLPPSVEDNQQAVLLDQNNMLDFVLHNVNRNQKKLEQGRQGLQSYGSEFNKKLFDYLVSKFKKLRKTKEQMVKYCVRKSFKHITNKMRASNREGYANMENNEVVAEYFQKNCEGDLSISMPFKKNSQEKTMNSNFLKKIFKCRQYNVDYREFLKQFPAQYHSDNRKKIRSMNDSIKKCVKNKCFKSLDQYKRLPWTTQILQKIFDFAKRLMEHSPYKKQQIDMKAMERKAELEKFQKQQSQEMLASQNNELDPTKIPTKKNVIILTPPVRILDQPQNLSSQQLLE